MFKMATPVIYSLLLTIIGSLILSCSCHQEEREIHVVYMGEKPGASPLGASSSLHHSILKDVVGSGRAKDSMVYSYRRSFNGFAAKLTKAEAARIKEMDGVVSVLPNTIYNLHTTRSWDFVGLAADRRMHFPTEGDVVVGLLDTGIWPESQSFSDKDMGPPPAKWKGTCQGVNFTCNNKIIGARFYNSMGLYDETDFKSPRDSEGHGSHTSSTAAGVPVPRTSYFGLAEGTARGAVPGARIAMYKVCWSTGCRTADILAAFDDAIADGVDVLSVSLGGPPAPYFEDAIAIGSFHAMRAGILTVNSAGNSGPYPRSVTNVAPWTLTVAASSIDRKFIAKVVLGDGQTFIGSSVNRFFGFDSVGSGIPLVYGGAAPNVSAGANDEISRFCLPGALNSFKVENKIVLCDELGSGSGVLVAEGIGAIMSSSDLDFAFSFPLPATVIGDEDTAKILAYIQSNSNPIATIMPGETMYDVMAPTVVSFSSRGPNAIEPSVLKPDLTAPGVDILAAWSPVASPSISAKDPTRVRYNVISGTSMSCPHVSGAAAYVKSVHPRWSPASIKSALMTTATVMDSRKHKDAEFSYGSGHIDPIKALNPGLVFDASEQDYVDFLCRQGYNSTKFRLLTGHPSRCLNSSFDQFRDGFNYPSFAIAVPDGQPILGAFRRTVTNVGAPNSTYYATVSSPYTFTVKVSPRVLSFASVGETKSFTVTVKGGAVCQQEIMSGYVLWKDGTHEVRTPIAVYTVLPPQLGSNTNEVPTSTSFGGSYRKNGILLRD